MKGFHSLFIVGSIILIPVVGYALMHLLVFVLQVSEASLFVQVVYTLALIGLGLAIPYWMLRLWMHETHLNHPEEREFRFRDIPKDKDQLYS